MDAAGAVGVFGVGFVDVDVEDEGVVGFGGEIVNNLIISDYILVFNLKL